jgi:hypothetical protein
MSSKSNGRGWYGDSEGHREASLKASENWFQTRWRHTKERLASLVPGGE